MNFTWSAAVATLADFGGSQVQLTIHKTGMPFFDALRLYGAIDLYIGLREDVFIEDRGSEWCVHGRARQNRLKERDIKAFRQVWTKKRPTPESFCQQIHSAVHNGGPIPTDPKAKAIKSFKGLDSALQAGIRHAAASDYATLQGGQTSPSTCCIAEIPLADGLLGFAGKKRVHTGVGDILFLPIFEGQIDLARVVSPLRVRIKVPNVTCAQALALLALRTSLFAEGYQDRLSAVVFNTAFRGQRSDNYSGIITIRSTAIGQAKAPDLVAHLYRVLDSLVKQAWTRRGVTSFVPDALTMSYWLLQPLSKHLSSFITSQERLHRDRKTHVFVNPDYIKEVFEMSIGSWQGDHKAVREFARAVASGIYYARMRGADDPQKAWYDEVTMLRSAPSAKAFVERALILIEQGHREHSQVGTTHRSEDFDPKSLLSSLGNDRHSFEAFRDLFRMYLLQESTFKTKEKGPVDVAEVEVEEVAPEDNEKEDDTE